MFLVQDSGSDLKDFGSFSDGEVEWELKAHHPEQKKA